ncbi:MAG: hypothetical protein HZC38_08320 [Chloroflexi bacterium]|nr:hypothetical protein [Chloroflexota bacterium]
MGRPRFFRDKQRLWRQAIFAWVVLFFSVIFFTVIALGLSIVLINRETIVIIAFGITAPLLTGAQIFLSVNGYYLKKSAVEVRQQISQPKATDFPIPQDRYMSNKTKAVEDEQGRLNFIGEYSQIPIPS